MINVHLIHGDRNGDSLEVTEDYHAFGLVVPHGFRSDGISVPRFLWRFLSPCITASSVTAGVIHDYLYRYQPKGWTRKQADDLFRSLLVRYGFGSFRAFLAWAGVRLFGWLAWRGNMGSACAGCPMDCKKCWRYKGDEK